MIHTLVYIISMWKQLYVWIIFVISIDFRFKDIPVRISQVRKKSRSFKFRTRSSNGPERRTCRIDASPSERYAIRCALDSRAKPGAGDSIPSLSDILFIWFLSVFLSCLYSCVGPSGVGSMLMLMAKNRRCVVFFLRHFRLYLSYVCEDMDNTNEQFENERILCWR